MGYRFYQPAYVQVHQFNWVTFWTAITAIIAILGVAIAWYELDQNRKISRADFIKKFVDSFFTEETRTFFTLLQNQALVFDEKKITDENNKEIDHLPYVKIKKQITEQLNGIVKIDPDKTGYSAFEIDDFLLGYFDDIQLYRRKGLIDFIMIEQTFGYYITEAYNNPEIKAYLEHKDNKGRYGDFKLLAQELNNFYKFTS